MKKEIKVNFFQLALTGFQSFNFSIFQFFNPLILSFFILHSLFFINVYSQHFLDQLEYNYNSTTNQLNYIKEAIGTTISSVDLDNQNSNNYTYDANGRLIGDASEGILKIEWTSGDKVKQVSLDDDNNGVADRILAFTYDAMGNRVKKTETFLTSWLSLSKPQLTTYYINNAAGQLISIYKDEGSGAKCTEIEITDGSDNIASASIVSKTEFERKVGFKNYELKDHLGSVRVVVNDIKEPISLKKIFKSNIHQSNDYYSYGMLMPGRSLIQVEGYRWGYQRKEKDDELKGNGNSYDFGARLLDPRVGRWLSIDPLAAKFPDKSPYNSMGNDPINKIDPDGRSEDNLTSDHSASYDSQHAFDDITPEAAATMRQAWLLPVEMGLGFTPVGPAIDAKDMYFAYKAGSVLGMGAAVIGYVPFGDLAKPLAKPLMRKAATIMRETHAISNLRISDDRLTLVKDFLPSPTTAFSGVFDTKTENILIYPSGSTKMADGSVPPTVVHQYGGHGDINRKYVEMTGAELKTQVAYTILYIEDGILELRYNSASVNSTYWGDLAASKKYHDQIASALEKETGLKVVPDKRIK